MSLKKSIKSHLPPPPEYDILYVWKGGKVMKEFLNVQNLVKNYGDFCAVDGLSFSVNDGEIFGLLGPNGAGKSTTMNVITSLYGLTGRELNAAALEALEFVGLSDRAKMKPKKMSGGMKRRLNIACGIAHRPKLIIMDEPTVGVDAQSREHILGSIKTLRERGATVIYTSHYMNEVEDICDRIAIIDHGKFVACGT